MSKKGQGMSWAESREFKIKILERWIPHEPVPAGCDFSIRIGQVEIGICFHPNFRDRGAVRELLKPWQLMAVGVPNFRIELASVCDVFGSKQPENSKFIPESIRSTNFAEPVDSAESAAATEATGSVIPLSQSRLFQEMLWNFEIDQLEVLKNDLGEDWIHSKFAAKQIGSLVRAVVAPSRAGEMPSLTGLLRILFRRLLTNEAYLSIQAKTVSIGQQTLIFLDPSASLEKEIGERCASSETQWKVLADTVTTLHCEASGELHFVPFPEESRQLTSDSAARITELLPVHAIVRESFSGFLEVSRIPWRDIFLEMVPLIRQHSNPGKEAHLLHRLADSLMNEQTQFWTLSAKRGGQLISLIESSLIQNQKHTEPPVALSPTSLGPRG